MVQLSHSVLSLSAVSSALLMHLVEGYLAAAQYITFKWWPLGIEVLHNECTCWHDLLS